MRAKSRLLTRRGLLRLAGGVTGGLVLGACKPAPTPQPTPLPQRVEVTKVVEKLVTPTARPAKPVTLKLWVTDRRTVNNMTKNFMMPDFTGRHPHITVQCEFMPEQDLMTKLNTTAAAGTPPDVASIDEQSLHILITGGTLRPMPDGLLNVEKEMGPRIATWYKLPVGDPQGKYYALPNGTMTSGIYYNEDLLKKHGYAPKNIPTKWDDFLKWAQSLTTWEGKDVKQSGFAFNKQEYAVQQTAMYQRGGFYFKNAKELAIRDGVVADSYQFMLDAYDKYKLDSRTSPLCRDFFTLGRAVTACSWTWWNGFLIEQFPNMKWGTLPWPSFTGQPPYTRADDDVGFVVSTPAKEADRLEAAWTLWRFLVGPDYQRQYCVLRGVQPALVSLRQEEQFTDKNPQWLAVAVTMQPGKYISEGIWAKELDDILKITHSATLEGADIKATLDKVGKQMEQIMPTLQQPLLWGKEGWAAHPEWQKM